MVPWVKEPAVLNSMPRTHMEERRELTPTVGTMRHTQVSKKNKKKKL